MVASSEHQLAATLADVLAASEDAVFFKDRAGRYLSINDAGARLLGRSREEILGRTDATLFAPGAAEKIIARDLAIMESGTPETYEAAAILDDREHWYRTTKGATRAADGTIDGLWGISRDITDERTIRLERAELREELTARERELTSVGAQLEESARLATLGRLAAVLAHEIRNPLAVILNATAIARRDVRESADPAVLDIIAEEVTRLNDLVGSLLDFGRPVPAVFSPQSLGPLVASVMERVMVAHAHKSLRLELVGLDLSVMARADDRLVRRALVNVVNNACEAMETGGALTVTLGTREKMAWICVTDTGPGLAEVTRQKLFQPFVTTKATGTGLGLYVVKRIVDDHGGYLEVLSDERGTSVTLAIPIAADESPRSTPPP